MARTVRALSEYIKIKCDRRCSRSRSTGCNYRSNTTNPRSSCCSNSHQRQAPSRPNTRRRVRRLPFICCFIRKGGVPLATPLKRLFAKAPPDARARVRRRAITVPKPQTRVRAADPITANRQDGAVRARVVGKVCCFASAARFGGVLYKRVSVKRSDLFYVAARRAVSVINIRRRDFSRSVRFRVGANKYFFFVTVVAAERYTVAPSKSIAPQILDTAIFASVLAVGITNLRPRRRFDRVRSARCNRRRIAVCLPVHNRLRVRRFHFNEP